MHQIWCVKTWPFSQKAGKITNRKKRLVLLRLLSGSLLSLHLPKLDSSGTFCQSSVSLFTGQAAVDGPPSLHGPHHQKHYWMNCYSYLLIHPTHNTKYLTTSAVVISLLETINSDSLLLCFVESRFSCLKLEHTLTLVKCSTRMWLVRVTIASHISLGGLI